MNRSRHTRGPDGSLYFESQMDNRRATVRTEPGRGYGVRLFKRRCPANLWLNHADDIVPEQSAAIIRATDWLKEVL